MAKVGYSQSAAAAVIFITDGFLLVQPEGRGSMAALSGIAEAELVNPARTGR